MSWTRFLRRARWDRERSRELQAYLDIETDENVARGMSPEDARHAARRKLGNLLQIREEIYRMNTVGFLETLWKDLLYGARLLRLNPGFALVAVASLALGIGANTAIFQLINAVRLRTLPVRNPQELAEIRIPDMTNVRGSINTPYAGLTSALWEQVQKYQQSFSGVFAWSSDDFNLAPSGELRLAHGMWVSGDFFHALGVRPLVGRVFSRADDHRGCGTPGAVISYAFWQGEFGGSASALGRKITLNYHPVEIIGVTPPGFTGLEIGRPFDLAVPLCSEAALYGYSYLDDGTIWWLTAMGRLKPGWSIERAGAHLSAISPGIFRNTLPSNYPREAANDYLAYRLGVSPAGTGVSTLRSEYADSLVVLLGIAALVLLIACANLATLMLARASARQREIAVRMALGASRGRLVAQLLAESLLLATAGAALGASLARWLSQVLVSLISTESDRWLLDLAPDWRVFAFAASLAILTCVLFGLAPALRATLTSPGAAMKAGGRGLTASRERFSLRRALVISQIALSLVLLAGALLFARSLRNLLSVDPGFRSDGVLIAGVDIARLGPPERWDGLRQRVLDRLRALPGVDAAAEAKIIPLGGTAADDHVWMDGADAHAKINPYFNWISADYFRTLKIPLLAGRDFNARDTRTSAKVAIVNQALIRQLGMETNPIGKRFRRESTPYEPEMVFEIVGLVRDAKYRSIREDSTPTVFVPVTQLQTPDDTQQILIRAKAPMAEVVSEVKHAIHEIGPETVFDFRVFQTRVREGLLRERLMATLSGFFGFLAVLLATIGLYGVMSYMVARRTNEIGLRMALGAGAGEVMRMITGEALTLLALGVGLGSILALAAAASARSLLFGLRPYDPGTLATAAGSLAAVALAAGLVPARRAARMDPMSALRDE